MENFKRHYTTYKMDMLPEIINYSFEFLGNIGNTGSIVRRRIKGPIKFYWHYAFIYGFDKENRLLLIENNKNGVECIFWNDFILDFKNFEIFHYETTTNNVVEIMKRAKERQIYSYNVDKNNCEHFVNYCIFKKLESIQVENTKNGSSILISCVETGLIFSQKPYVPILLNLCNKFRETYEINRGNPEFDKIVENKIKNTPIPLQTKLN